MPSVTLANLSDAVYAKLENNSLFYPQEEVTWAINEGLKLGNLFCGWINKTESVASGGVTISNRHLYRVPHSIAIPQKVVFEGKELDKIGLFQLFRYWPNWMRDTSHTTGQPVNRWSPMSLNAIIIHPADSAGGGFLEITGIANLDPLSALTDSISIPKSAIQTVADYAAHIVQCKLGSVPLTQSMPMYRSFIQFIKQNRIWSKYKQPNFWLDSRMPE